MILNTFRNLINLTCIKSKPRESQQASLLELSNPPEILKRKRKTLTGDLHMQVYSDQIKFSFILRKNLFPKAWNMYNNMIRPSDIKILTCDIEQKSGKAGIYSVGENCVFKNFEGTHGCARKLETEYVSPLKYKNSISAVYIKPIDVNNLLLEGLRKKSIGFKLKLTFDNPDSKAKKETKFFLETHIFRLKKLGESEHFEIVQRDLSETMKTKTNNKKEKSEFQTENGVQTIIDTEIENRQIDHFSRSSHIVQKNAHPVNDIKASIVSQPENTQPKNTEAKLLYPTGVHEKTISNQQPPNDTEKNGISDRINSPILESDRQPSHIVKKIALPVNDLKAPIISQPENPQPGDTEAEHLYSIEVNQETITNQHPSNNTEKNGISEIIESSVLELHGQPTVNLYSKDDEKQEELFVILTRNDFEKYIPEGSIKVDEKQSEFSQVIDIDGPAEQVQCFKEEQPEETGEDYDKWLLEEKQQRSADFSSKEESASISKHESLRNTRDTKDYSCFKTLIFWLLVTIFILLIVSLVYCLIKKKLLNRR
ncbi:hypothetical protein CDIK_2478 [Cucumispora dikerogammari]|nr:hypothetical protein CDIK_2478 [Cucumispora dikerogammari]